MPDIQGIHEFLSANPRLTVWTTIAAFLVLSFGARYLRSWLGIGLTVVALMVFVYTVTLIHIPWILILGLGLIALGVNLVRRYQTISVGAGVIMAFAAVIMKVP